MIEDISSRTLGIVDKHDIMGMILLNELGSYLTTTSLSSIRCGFAPGFVNYKKGCTRLVAASDKVYQLLAHGRWFSQGTPASSTTKTGCHDIAEILLKVALNKINQIKSNQPILYFYVTHLQYKPFFSIFSFMSNIMEVGI